MPAPEVVEEEGPIGSATPVLVAWMVLRRHIFPPRNMTVAMPVFAPGGAGEMRTGAEAAISTPHPASVRYG